MRSSGLSTKYPDEPVEAIRASVHQAGHLVAAWHCGFSIAASAAIYDCDEEREHLPAISPSFNRIRQAGDLVRACRGWEELAMVRCAGPQAESLMTDSEDSLHSHHDYCCARGLLDEVAESPGHGLAIFRMAQTRARSLMLQRAASIGVIAELVLRQLIVDGPQLRAALTRLEGPQRPG